MYASGQICRHLSPVANANRFVRPTYSTPTPKATKWNKNKRVSCPRQQRKSPASPAIPEGIADKVDENELSRLEADEPYEMGKVIAKEGTMIKVGENEFTLLLPLVNDYGIASMMPIDGNQPVLIHYESNKSKAKRIKNETKVLLYGSERKLKHTYRIVLAGYYDRLKIQYLVTRCYGLSISDLQGNQPNERFTKPTCLKLGLVTMKCIQQLHETGFVHRDIKPAVFVTGQGAPHEIYIVHFGLARRFRAKDRTHVKQRASLPLIGNVKYISRNAHKRRDRSQRDDLESWFYMFIEMFDKELLPWAPKTDLEDIRNDKELFMTEKGFYATLKACRDIPAVFYEIIRHINTLNFTTEADFHKLKKLFQKEIDVNNFRKEPYDWIKAELNAGHHVPKINDTTSVSSEDIKSGPRSGRGSPARGSSPHGSPPADLFERSTPFFSSNNSGQRNR